MNKFNQTLLLLSVSAFLTACGGVSSSIDTPKDNGNKPQSQLPEKDTQAPDTTKPVISLVGDATIKLIQGAPYKDAGAVANDNKDGDITSSIVVTNNVDTNTLGEYTISYDVKDAAGNIANTVRRIVTVNPVPNNAPELTGQPKTSTAVYSIYRFKPSATDSDGDSLSFSIKNKPEWLQFDNTTGLLKGIPLSGSKGTYANIIISVTDGTDTVSLKGFDIEVGNAVNIAHKYGKAIQGSTYLGNVVAYGANNAIDNNLSTFNHTKCDTDNDWWQLELPSPTQIAEIVIHNRAGQQARLNGVKVYLTDSNDTTTVTENALIKTLDSSMEQSINFEPKKEGRYLFIKSTTCLHTPEVQVYGTAPSTPDFKHDNYKATIHRWYNKSEAVLTVDAVDYQEDTLTYQIVGSVPFEVDTTGVIRVKDVLTEDTYQFKVKISDGFESATAPVVIDINNTAKANHHTYTDDATPALTGYLPNTYTDGDSITITINGITYTPTINNDGTWSIANDEISPRLEIGDYSISITINNDTPIVYKNFLEVYGTSEYAQNIVLTPSYVVENINVTIASSSSTPLPRGKKVRASSMWLKHENGQTVFVNDSYRKMKSVITSYKDNNNIMVFKKLTFDKAIEPYSENNLTSFDTLDKMQLFKTAGHFNKEIFFAADDRICTEYTNDTRKECSPTNRNETPYAEHAVREDVFIEEQQALGATNPVFLSEQQVYTQVVATWHHLYNRVDGLKSIDAWINREMYKDMDYTTDYQSSDEYAQGEGKMEFFKRNFFAVFLPNNTTVYYVMRYQYTSMGLSGMPNQITSFEGEWTQGGWAALWDGAVKLGKENSYYSTEPVFRTLPFEYIHHEGMHSNGMGHDTGLTYGWPHFGTKRFIRKYYTPENIDDADSAIFPEVKAPKYIFTTEPLSENSVKLTVHKTNDANSENLTFEVFSGNGGREDDFVFEKIDENSVKLTFDETVFPRFFVRVYGDDSDELMSKLITPSLMMQASQTIITDINETNASESKKYYFIPHAQWGKITSLMDREVAESTALGTCKIITNNLMARRVNDADAEKVHNDFTAEVNTIEGSKKFYGLEKNYWSSIFDFSNSIFSQERLSIIQDVKEPITDEEIGLMCVSPL